LFKASSKKPDKPMDAHTTSELELIRNALTGTLAPCKQADDPREWARLGFWVGFKAFEMVRQWRLKTGELSSLLKSDGSPATYLEKKIEEVATEALGRFYPEASFWGEESGQSVATQGKILLLMDPIDGTRSFLGGFDTYAVTLTILKEKRVLFSLICAPATGDFGYRIGDQGSRLFQYPLAPSDIAIVDLPYIPSGAEPPLLVNMHAAKAASQALEQLHKLWHEKKIALVRSLSGSPSKMILEVARGGGVYINAWSGGPTMPYDLIAASHILRGAGGRLLALSGEEVDPWTHQGMYLAGISESHLGFLREALKAFQAS
jgi:3'(2'), 5'-bisphosphate nucleotidase